MDILKPTLTDAAADADQVLATGEQQVEKLVADISAQADETGKDLENNAEAQGEKLLTALQAFLVNFMGAPNAAAFMKLLMDNATQYKISISLEKK